MFGTSWQCSPLADRPALLSRLSRETRSARVFQQVQVGSGSALQAPDVRAPFRFTRSRTWTTLLLSIVVDTLGKADESTRPSVSQGQLSQQEITCRSAILY